MSRDMWIPARPLEMCEKNTLIFKVARYQPNSRPPTFPAPIASTAALRIPVVGFREISRCFARCLYSTSPAEIASFGRIICHSISRWSPLRSRSRGRRGLRGHVNILLPFGMRKRRGRYWRALRSSGYGRRLSVNRNRGVVIFPQN